uniref:Uncharacterized protein n=1 Tax=Schistocephalus solidus TaxID=70667 RepID=A0A0X3QCZ8_SCHSO
MLILPIVIFLSCILFRKSLYFLSSSLIYLLFYCLPIIPFQQTQLTSLSLFNLLYFLLLTSASHFHITCLTRSNPLQIPACSFSYLVKIVIPLSSHSPPFLLVTTLLLLLFRGFNF